MFIGTLDPTTTRQGWKQLVELIDEDTGEGLDITGAEISVEIRDPRTLDTLIVASISSGVTIVDTGVFQISISPDMTRNIRRDTYEVGVILTLNGETIQLVIGALPILDGIVTA